MSKTFRLSFHNNAVQMNISGIQGGSCAQVSAAINQNLGSTVKNVHYKDEFYVEPPNTEQLQQERSLQQ